MIHQYFRVGPRQAAGALIINDSDQLLLVRDRLRREWSYPGGYLDRGEDPLVACAREVREEVGLQLDLSRLTQVETHHWHRPLGRLVFTTFLTHVTAAEAANLQLQRRELLEARWVNLPEAVQLIAPRLRPRLVELLRAIETL